MILWPQTTNIQYYDHTWTKKKQSGKEKKNWTQPVEIMATQSWSVTSDTYEINDTYNYGGDVTH